MTITTGTRFGHYEVTAPLGKGGMGEVCLAKDTRLKRKVALKLLPAEFTFNAERLRRFELEAKAASGLNHPNIITIYDIGEAHNTHFIATEYIEGETLRDRLRRKKLTLNETLDIALQIADALAAAHQAGIIHRDIKPENVMIRNDGIVKVLDFGLAKLTERKGEGEKARLGEDDATLALSPAPSHATDPGAVMGTPQYMSPEQARGQQVDARTDIFSFGTVLYEMLAGRPPFQGVNVVDVMAAILDREPPSLKSHLPDLPPTVAHELEHGVTKALRKDREQRWQHIKDLLIDLRECREELIVIARQARAAQTEATATVATPEATSPTNEAVAVSTKSSGKIILGEIKRHRLGVALTLAVIVLATVATFFYFKRQPVLTDKDTILLADFTNTTGDAVFDGTLKQALAVHLGQSPFLNLFADERVRETLRLMNRSPDERVTPTVGREICQRQGLKAMLTGTIASLGRNYVINLEAVNGQTGDVLAREQGEAEGKEQVLQTLGEAATRLRGKLGESLGSIQKFDVRLEHATTSSLEAFKAFSLGFEQNSKGKYFEAISSYNHALELDPNFALAHAVLGATFGNSGQPGLAVEPTQKAFALRERVSEREKLHITWLYYWYATGESNKVIEVLELLKQTYPRDYLARHSLGVGYGLIGQYENAIEELREAIRLHPNSSLVGTYGVLARTFSRLNHFEEAKEISEQALAQKLDSVHLRGNLYNLAFIHGDTAAMQQQSDWVNGQPGEYAHLTWQASAAAFAGQWQRAREFSNRAAELARQRKLQEVAGDIVSANAEWAAVLGHCQQSRAELTRAAALPRTSTSLFRAGIALALCGDAAQAQALNDEAVKRYPKHTIVNEINLPLIRAALELQRGNRTQVIQILSAASRYESVSFFYQNYLRAQAYLGERNGAAAGSEFQTILDHRGWTPTSPLYPLAHLGLARAAMLQGDTAKARKSYEDFFALWKDADTDLPVLIEARKEYEKVK